MLEALESCHPRLAAERYVLCRHVPDQQGWAPAACGCSLGTNPARGGSALQDCSGFPTAFAQTDSPQALFCLPPSLRRGNRSFKKGQLSALRKGTFPKSVQSPKIKFALERMSQPPVSLQETHLPRSGDQAPEGGWQAPEGGHRREVPTHCTGSLTWKRCHVWGSTRQMLSTSPHLHHRGLVWRVAFSIPRGEGPPQEAGGFRNNGRVGEVAAGRADTPGSF